MTNREVQRRNNVAFFFAGIAFLGLGIFDCYTGNSGTGTLFTAAGVMFLLPILLRSLGKKRRQTGKKPPGHMDGKHG